MNFASCGHLRPHLEGTSIALSASIAGHAHLRRAGCFEPAAFRSDLSALFRRLKRGLGDPFPYLWVPEWHPRGHGLHGHFAVGRYVKRGLIDASWGQGFVHIKLLGNLPVGSGRFEEARAGARYLAKYVGKDLGTDRMAGLHRYDVARGFEPATVQLVARRVEEARDRLRREGALGHRPAEPSVARGGVQRAGWPADGRRVDASALVGIGERTEGLRVSVTSHVTTRSARGAPRRGPNAQRPAVPSPPVEDRLRGRPRRARGSRRAAARGR